MTVNSFEREESNANVDSAQYYIDTDGSFKFISPILASSNFDGSIPVFEGTVDADELESGMLIQLSDSQYYPIIDIFKDDPDLEDDPSDLITVNYIDANTDPQTVSFNSSDSVEVRYEDWDEKYLGTQGWALTYGGNAIFANVGVRGEIEATTLDVGGVNGITYDGSTVTIGASVVVNAPIEFNGVTPEELSASLSSYIPDGGAASDIITNSTTITGGNIETGRIRSFGYDGPFSGGGSFSTKGSQFNLDDGSIVTPNFRITNDGSAFFRGDITGSNGTFSGTLSAGVSITSPTISGGTITGSVIQTSATNDRVVLNEPGRSGQVVLYHFNNTFSTIYRGSSRLEISTDTNVAGQLRADNISLSAGTGIGNISCTNLTAIGAINCSVYIGTTQFNLNRPSGNQTLSGVNIDGNARNITQFNINQNLGTGNSPAFAGLTVSGTTFIPDAYTAIVSNRVVNVNSSGRLGNPSSSYLIKKNISPLLPPDPKFYDIVPGNKIIEEDISSYRKILDLTPIKFEWDIEDQTPGPEFGLIAEEVVEKMPESSLPGDENVPAYYKITSLFAALLGVVKDQQKTIEDLEARMLQLESQLGG